MNDIISNIAIENLTINDLFTAGVHFGHLKRFANPKMAPFVYGLKNKIQIINLDKTLELLRGALQFVSKLSARGGNILFVGTKKPAQKLLVTAATRCKMPYVNYHWLGGMLTNYKTIKQSIRRLVELEKILSNELVKRTKKELLMLKRELSKLNNSLGGIRNMNGLPDALFVIDVKTEHTAVMEARRLKIPIIGIVDTNSDPDGIDYLIPGNDDAKKAISLYLDLVANTIINTGATQRMESKAEILEEENAFDILDDGEGLEIEE